MDDAGEGPPHATGRDVVGELARMGYGRARRLLLVVGIVILVAMVVGLAARSVDHVEVVGTLLYIPILIALLYFGLVGGVVAGVVATGVYVLLRLDAIDAVGFGEFSGTVIGHGIGYVLFGAVGGWAAGTLAVALDKLDLHDRVDDVTGLDNARGLRLAVDLERERAVRYRTLFSIVFVDIDADAITALSPRRRRRVLRELGRRLGSGMRSMDRAAHGFDGRVHHLAVVLPETAGSGASIVGSRLIGALHHEFDDQHLDVTTQVTICTLPGDEVDLDARLGAWQDIEAAEHRRVVG